jgi:O-antigen ligase
MLAVVAGLSLTQLSPLEGTACIGLLAVGIGTLLEPFVGLGTALFLGPLKAYLSAEVPQIPAQIGHAFIALALASWLMRGLSEREILRSRQIHHLPSPVFLPLVAFLGSVLLSLWDAVGLVAYGIPELIKWIEILVLFVFVKEHLAASAAASPIRQPSGAESDGATPRLRWLLLVLFGTGVFQALVGIWQFGLRGEGPEHFRILGGDFFRAYGTFEQPNPYAGYLALTAALAAGTVLGLAWDRLMGHSAGPASPPTADRPADKPIPWLFHVLGAGGTAVMLIALIASWSRGAWMGFGAAVLAMAAALPRKAIGSVLLVTGLVIAGAGLYASGQLPASFVARLTTFVQDIRLEDVRGVPINDANYAVVERLAHWQAALSMVRHRLWTGVGFGCYEPAYLAFALINWPIALGHAHNIYLNLAAETGLIGLTAYLILWGVVLWQTWRMTRRARGLMRGLSVGLLGAWTHISVHHVLDNLYVNNVHLHIGVLLGLAAFIVQRTNQIVHTES